MKPVLLNFTDEQGQVTRTFTVCSIKAGMMDNIFDLAEKGESFEKGELKISEVKVFFKDLKALIVEVFAGQFTYDELNEGVDTRDLMAVFSEVCGNIVGSMRKN